MSNNFFIHTRIFYIHVYHIHDMYSVHIPQVSYLKFRHVRLASVFNNDKEYIYNVHVHVDVH